MFMGSTRTSGRSGVVGSLTTHKLSRRNRVMLASVLAVPAVVAMGQSSAQAQLYWDANGTTDGASVTPNGTWGIDSFWNDQADGGAAGVIGAWTPDAQAIFSAGSDATGAYTVTVDSTQSAGGITIKDGTLTLTGGTINLSSPSVNVTAADATIDQRPLALACACWAAATAASLFLRSMASPARRMSASGANTLSAGI